MLALVLVQAKKAMRWIFFFIKNDFIQGACGIGKVGKIGRDIKLASRILTKKIKVNQKEIEDQNFKLNKLLR